MQPFHPGQLEAMTLGNSLPFGKGKQELGFISVILGHISVALTALELDISTRLALNSDHLNPGYWD